MIRFYSTSWCPDCHRARAVLERRRVAFEDIDIDIDPEAAGVVLAVNRGMRSVPTIVFGDGTHLTEPSNHVLEKKLDELAL